MLDELQRVRWIQRADVYKRGELAGWLERTPEGVRFDYDPDYLASGGPPVATSLPPSKAPTVASAGAVPPFFAGLLPEGRRLLALRRAVKTSADDELSLLLAVGADAVGDVQIIPAGEPPDRPAPHVAVADWSSVRFADLMATSPEAIDLTALPGVQDKVSAATIAVPARASQRAHILKLNPPEFPHVVENEAFFLDAARRSGFDVAEAVIVTDADDERGLLVTRFDRVPDDAGGLRALAQEDACQVMGRYPADTYTVTSEEAVTALAGVTRARKVTARDAIAQIAFAYLSANGDLHAKNLSVHEQADGEWRLSPAYDMPSTHPYGDTTMALPVDERTRDDITRDNFVALGAHAGVTHRAIVKTLDRLCERVDLWIDDLDRIPLPERRIRELRRVIDGRRRQLAG